MSRIIAGICVRDKYPDYPRGIENFQEWQILEKHTIEIRLALQSTGDMNCKLQLMRHTSAGQRAMEERGHDSLVAERCSCYKKWIKIRKTA